MKEFTHWFFKSEEIEKDLFLIRDVRKVIILDFDVSSSSALVHDWDSGIILKVHIDFLFVRCDANDEENHIDHCPAVALDVFLDFVQDAKPELTIDATDEFIEQINKDYSRKRIIK